MKNNRYLLYTVILLLSVVSCKKETITPLDVTLSKDMFSFRAISGGAVMKYKLSDESVVAAVKVRYTDSQDKDRLVVGSWVADSLTIIGFDEAMKGVTADITLADVNGVESEPITLTFDTEDSGPVIFMNTLKVESSWDGFRISYDLPEGAKGLSHLYYMREDTVSHELCKTFIKTISFDGDKGSVAVPIPNCKAINSITVATEDVAGGYIVKSEDFEVPAYASGMLPNSQDFIVTVPEGLEHETTADEPQNLGARYLFDGDFKGENNFGLGYRDDIYNTFLVGPEATGKPIVVDMLKEQKLAYIKIYGMLNGRDKFCSISSYKYGLIWNYYYYNKLPSSLTISLTNTPDDESSWVECGTFEQDKDLPIEERWSYRCATCIYTTELDTLEEMAEAEAAYIRVDVPADMAEYRYMRIVVNEVFDSLEAHANAGRGNDLKYVSFHELEIFGNIL